jgi:hypothetical protein
MPFGNLPRPGPCLVLVLAEASLQRSLTPGSGRAELAGYVLAVLVLVVGGAFVLGPILNWVSGPVIVVVCVWLTTSLNERRSRGGGAK